MIELLIEAQAQINELTARLAERDAQIAALKETVLRLDVLVAQLQEAQNANTTDV